MRHLDIRGMWFQNEVLSGKAIVDKVGGARNPANLMTKGLGIQDVVDRLAMMDLDIMMVKATGMWHREDMGGRWRISLWE